MRANDAGRMIAAWWRRLPDKFPTCETDAFALMPNHIHGIITLRGSVGADPRVRPITSQPPTLSRIVQWFKTMTTNEYLRNVEAGRWEPIISRLWQRNYYEHIVRDEEDLERIRVYIEDNPRNWSMDPDFVAVP
jgi:REP element-mobilizing transposase RayT